AASGSHGERADRRLPLLRGQRAMHSKRGAGGSVEIRVLTSSRAAVASLVTRQMWAPEIRPAGSRGGYALSFTASRFASVQSPCPDYDEGSGVFMAYSDSVLGPYNSADVHPEAIGASTDAGVCPLSVHDSLPFSHPLDTHDCGSRLCNNSLRLDGDL